MFYHSFIASITALTGTRMAQKLSYPQGVGLENERGPDSLALDWQLSLNCKGQMCLSSPPPTSHLTHYH